MDIQKAEGIVLRKIPVLEADVADIIYTQNHGKRTFIFKGIKKTKRRSLSAIEPGSIVQLVYYYNEQKQMLHVKEFSLLHDTLSLRNNYQSMITLFLLLEIVDKTTGFNDPNEKIYTLLKGAIQTLHQTNAYIFFALAFVIHYLKISGILPDFFHCTVCQKDVSGDVYMSEYQLTVFCNNCAPPNAIVFKAIAPVMNEILTKKFMTIETNKYDSHDIKKFLFNILIYIDHYFNINIKTKDLLFNTTI
ncbi:MAG: DNA repair protein RecO [Spirochaetes bacterium]|nr:DNA repair protein RecO [Spirochaetota bacterium]